MAERVHLIRIGYGYAITGSLPPAAIGDAYSRTLTAIGGVGIKRLEILSENVSDAIVFTDNGDNTATFAMADPQTAGTYSVTVRATDADRQRWTRTFTFQVVALPLAITGSLNNCTVGSVYSDTLTVSGGVQPYSLDSSVLPAGLSANLVGDTITISGTPTGAGLGPGTSFNFAASFTVTDDIGGSVTFEQTITITVTAVTAVFDPTPLLDGTVGTPYTAQVDASGGIPPYAYAVTTGALPAGVSLNTSTGEITGTPTTAATGVSFTVTVTDSVGNSDDVTDTVDVVGDPFWANVVSLLNFDGTDGSTTFSDATGRTWTANGNAQIDTSLGYNTGLFDGGGDNVTTPYVTADFDWWTTDFTIEAWIYIVSAGAWSYNPGIDVPAMVGCASTSSVTNYWSFGPLGDGTVRFYYYNGSPQTVTNSTAVSTGALQHIAMSKTSSGIYIASHGTVSGPTAVSGTPQSSTSGVSMTLGQINNTSINGHVRALRVTKGVARYTSNFTPPTAPFPDS